MPNLGRYEDISQFLLDPGQLSESEGEIHLHLHRKMIRQLSSVKDETASRKSVTAWFKILSGYARLDKVEKLRLKIIDVFYFYETAFFPSLVLSLISLLCFSFSSWLLLSSAELFLYLTTFSYSHCR